MALSTMSTFFSTRAKNHWPMSWKRSKRALPSGSRPGDPGYAKFYWQNGYGAFSIGQSGVEALKKYIAKQKEHHRKKTFQDEFRAFLAKYQVEYDERYVW